MQQALQIEWKSSFDFILKDEAAKQTFLSCEVHARPGRRTERVSRSEFESASRSWRCVERRVRETVLKLAQKPSMKDFISAMEWLLNFFVDSGAIPAPQELPLSILSRVDQPIAFSAQGELCVSFGESSCHRLLLHAICRYHGFTSKVIVLSITLYIFTSDSE